MAKIRAFRGVRPAEDKVEKIASKPYDVLNSEEAREIVAKNPDSFLRVVKPEVDLPKNIDLYSKEVYNKAKENLYGMIENGNLIQDEKPSLYLYKLVMNEIEQVGLVAGTSIEDYENNVIKKHEYTRAKKEKDRITHVDTSDANTGPVFLTYQAQEDLNKLFAEIQKNKPVYDFVAEDEVEHVFWKIDDEELISKIEDKFANIESLYVADGHHRSAAGTKVGQMRREANENHTGEEEYNFFLSVIFPHNHLYVMDYNRIVKDLNGLSNEEFLKKIEENFEIEEYSSKKAYSPEKLHTFGMYFDKKWYKLTSKDGSFPKDDAVNSLDVAIMQNNLLAPILNIGDPRKDERIDFVGGIRGLGELSKRVDTGEAVAFSMFPTSIEELMNIADENKVMPPKSTWFEPKLRSGMVVHLLK